MTPPRCSNKRRRLRMGAPGNGDADGNDQIPSGPVSAMRAYRGFSEEHIALLQHAAQSFQQGLHQLLSEGIFCPIRGAILWYVLCVCGRQTAVVIDACEVGDGCERTRKVT